MYTGIATTVYPQDDVVRNARGRAHVSLKDCVYPTIKERGDFTQLDKRRQIMLASNFIQSNKVKK